MKGIFLNKDIKYALFILSLTIGYGLLFVIWEFRDIPCSGFTDFLILVLQWGIITLASFPYFFCWESTDMFSLFLFRLLCYLAVFLPIFVVRFILR